MIVEFTTSDNQPVEAQSKRVEIRIGENTYLLSESVDGKLNVNKSDGDDGNISVHPRYANVVELL